jgi:hypothetical protein
MTRMTTSLLTLALLVPTVSAAPAPDVAKEKLEALKKKLSEVVEKWGRDNAVIVRRSAEQAELRLARQVSPIEAKVTVLLNGSGEPPEPLTIYLRYYDGSWTSTRFEGRRKDAVPTDDDAVAAIRRLMLAIDELGEK